MQFEEIDSKDEALIEAAREVLQKRYRDDRHTVAAAVLSGSGQVYVGLNIEACGYGPCAEPIALGAAFTNGDSDIRRIVAVRRREDSYPVLSPCGNCRQIILEHAPKAMVIFENDGRIMKATARNLLPGPYTADSRRAS